MTGGWEKSDGTIPVGVVLDGFSETAGDAADAMISSDGNKIGRAIYFRLDFVPTLHNKSPDV